VGGVSLSLAVASAGVGPAVAAATPSAAYQEMTAAQQEAQRLTQELVGLDVQLVRAEGELARLQSGEAEARRNLASLQDRLDALQRLLASRRSQVDAVVRFLYEDGTVSFLAVLLQSASFADFLTRFAYLRAVVGYEVQLLREVAAEQRSLDEGRRVAAAAEARLQEQVRGVARQVAALQALRQQRQALLSSAEARAAALSGRLAELDRSILGGLPAVEYLLAHFGELPWGDMSPDRVDVSVAGVRAVFGEGTLDALLQAVPQLAGLAFDLQDGVAAVVLGPPADVRLAGPVVVDGGALRWEPDTLEVGGVPAAAGGLSGVLAGRPLRIAAPAVPGLNLRSVAVRPGALEVDFSP
jgi:peptidoglycan hydrolase CwlO-like protein